MEGAIRILKTHHHDVIEHGRSRSERRAPEKKIQFSTGFDADNRGKIKDSRVAQDYAAPRDAERARVVRRAP
jgi:hypothetical protein